MNKIDLEKQISELIPSKTMRVAIKKIITNLRILNMYN